MRTTLIIAALVGGIAAPALAQEQGATTSFRGFRVEGNVGLDRFQSEGSHDDGLGYGGTVGWDGMIGDRIVIGPEFSYWRARQENITPGVGDLGTVTHKSFNELNASVRVGALVTPRFLVYAKGGYANSEQRKAFIAPPGQSSYYNHFHTDGYTVGGGGEFSLTDRFYVNAEYRYTNYNTDSARQRVSVGAGVRF
ncbi:outer membrane protein [Sphingomonas quercus]|uniref:Porin family protein n=1 Tax=Sphingomonas quercus TaxID=2842451 RepID=A0ABS6BKI9_9SPHN|nr:porin family protein [Sphingomonas quercus]MBU3077961.1 porin family protein [Sphingomonas quercus]